MSVALALVAAGWVAGWVLLWRLPPLGRSGAPRGSSSRPLTVVVPARDEERSLPALLGSLREQRDVGPLQLLVADDGSTDATAMVAESGGATVITVPPLPPGWLGKPWACATALRHASHELIVLLDADVVLAPDALSALVVEHAAAAPDGLLSVQPVHITRAGHEQLSLVPNVVALLASGLGRIGRAARSDDRVAFGPCLVTTRTALAAVGGFATVAGKVVEDLALARAFRGADLPVATRAGDRRVAFRMYPAGLGQLADGWSKHLAVGASGAPWPSTMGAVLWVTGLLASIGVVVGAASAGRWPVALLTWGVVAAQVRVLGRRVGSFRWWAAAAYPALAGVFVGLFARSALHRLTGRPVVWRGRRVRPGGVVP